MSVGLAALRAAATKDRENVSDQDNIKERLARVVGRSVERDDTPKPERRNYAQDRLKEILEKDVGRDGQSAVHKLDGHSEKLEIDDEREQEKDREVEKDRDIDRGPMHGL